MKPQFNFHKRIGMTPGFGVEWGNCGGAGVIVLRLWWSSLTFTFDIPKRYRKVGGEELRYHRRIKEWRRRNELLEEMERRNEKGLIK